MKNTVKNKDDFNKDIPRTNKSILCIEWYRLKMNVANNASTRQNFNPLYNTFKIDELIFLKFDINNFIIHSPNLVIFCIFIKNRLFFDNYQKCKNK